MRRALSIALILIVVFAAAVVAGFWGATRLAPERVRVVAEHHAKDSLPDLAGVLRRTRQRAV